MLDRLLCCVGPMKGGTTWLMWHLRHSPDVFFAPEKELHYHYGRDFWPDGIGMRLRAYQLGARLLNKNLWPDHLLGKGYRAGVVARYADRFAQNAPQDAQDLAAHVSEFRENMVWYRDYMSDPTNQDWYDRIFGGAGSKWPCDFSTTTGMMGPGGFRKLSRSARDVRLIYFIRNPYDRLWSHARWHAMVLGRWDEFQGMSSAQRTAFIRRYRLHRHSLAAGRIKAMRRAVGSDKVLVLNFDEIETAPETLLSLVSDFMGIAPIPIVEDLGYRHAASPELATDTEALAPFAKDFEADIDRLGAMGYPAALGWKSGR